MKAILVLLFGITAHLSTSYAETALANPLNERGPLTVSVDGSRNFSEAETVKLEQAEKLINIVMNSDEFKNAVLNFSYNGVPGFVQNLGMTNQEIYDYLMQGAERYPAQTEADHKMNFDIELYTSSWFGRGTLGYTDTSTKTIHINTRFYDKTEANGIAMNMVHEWTHKMGFDHDQNRTARRDYSVPYGVGYIVRDLAAKINLSTLK
jgi:hypothetical protein